MRALLDVNVLLALFDPEHAHHASARSWWVAHRDDGWASCPLTQNGFVRILSNVRYPRPLAVGDAISVLQAQTSLPDHAFWPDEISLLDTAVFEHDRILGPKQLTDVYLLALAVKHGGRFATFDRGISVAAVRDAAEPNVVML